MNNKPKVGIVITNYNGGEMLARCLETLERTTYSNYEVIFIDNKSTNDDVLKVKKKYKDYHIYILRENYGYARGVNVGWKIAVEELKCDYVCLLDNDTEIIQEEWLDIAISELEKRKDCGISGSKLLFPDLTLQTMVTEKQRGSLKDCGQEDFVEERDFVLGAGIIIKSELVKKLGYYDENFFYGPNDVDYCLRAKEIGYKTIYNGFYKIIHIGSASYLSARKDFIFRHQSYGMMLFNLRHNPDKKSLFSLLRGQFFRVFVTRKNPYESKGIKNLHFHISFIKRFYYFLTSAYSAIKNFNEIKSTDGFGDMIEYKRGVLI